MDMAKIMLYQNLEALRTLHCDDGAKAITPKLSYGVSTDQTGIPVSVKLPKSWLIDNCQKLPKPR
jgi:hypothetical protein